MMLAEAYFTVAVLAIIWMSIKHARQNDKLTLFDFFCALFWGILWPVTLLIMAFVLLQFSEKINLWEKK